ncbi:MAG: glycosyltransferase family 4 protein, partial [Acidobacteriales bacterium]|nr:glycosyltransferase family 4 protein [Terriglobales bacterium]
LQRSAFSRWIVGQAVTGADAVVIGCSYMRRLLTQAGYPVQESRIHTIPLGVDTQSFVPAPKPAHSRHLIHVASLIPVKDQPMLLRAFARLPPDVTLEIVGDGPERPHLEQLAQTLGITERVHFAGAVAYPDLPRHYQQAALHILSSQHEGFGMVTLEAAACAVPTVGTAVGVLPDYPAMGLPVPVGDDAALARAIHTLLDDEARRVALGTSARALVEREMTVAHTVEQLRRLYKELTQRHKG